MPVYSAAASKVSDAYLGRVRHKQNNGPELRAEDRKFFVGL
jgi:hypothetical protein